MTAPVRPPRPSAGRNPPWVGGLVGIAAIVAVWWLSSALFFSGSGSIPSPGEVFALFLDGDQLISALPSLFAALKIAAPAAFLGAILAEYLGSGGDSTLGRALIAAQTQSDAPQLWYLALVSGLISGLGYLLVGLVARLVVPGTGDASSAGGGP